MEDKYKATIAGIGIVCVTALAAFGLHKGIDGTVLASVIGFVGGVVGYCFGVLKT